MSRSSAAMTPYSGTSPCSASCSFIRADSQRRLRVRTLTCNSRALRAVVVLGHIEQLAADVQGRQAEEVAGGCDGQLLERALQAEDGVLEDVVGLLPAVHLRI